MSVRPFVRLDGIEFVLQFGSFKLIFLKPCILVVHVMKMCMWDFDGARINFKRITTFRSKLC